MPPSPEATTAWGTSVQPSHCVPRAHPPSNSSMSVAILLRHTSGKSQGGKAAACLSCALPCSPPWLFAFRAREVRDSKPLAVVRPDPRAERDKLRLFGNHNQVYGAIHGRLLFHSGHISYIDLSYLIFSFMFMTFARRLVVFSLELKDRSWDRSLDWDWRTSSRCVALAYDEM